MLADTLTFACLQSWGKFHPIFCGLWCANEKLRGAVGRVVLVVSFILWAPAGEVLLGSSCALASEREIIQEKGGVAFGERGLQARDEKLAWAQAGEGSLPKSSGSSQSPSSVEKPTNETFAWQSLFDGKELGKWAITRFGGEGEVTIKDGAIVLGMGNPMTGITWTGEVIRDNYELELEAKRTSGIDFFATTTFPVGEQYCSFVVGGWAGTVVGLSSVNNLDASENETTQFKVFQDNRWYKIRIRVSQPKIECWINEEKIVDIKREGRKFSIRMECDLCRPLGIATWCTESMIRNIRIRRLTPQEVIDIAEGLR